MRAARGRCPACWSVYALTADGRLRAHTDTDGARCPGSRHRPPGARLPATPLEVAALGVLTAYQEFLETDGIDPLREALGELETVLAGREG